MTALEAGREREVDVRSTTRLMPGDVESSPGQGKGREEEAVGKLGG